MKRQQTDPDAPDIPTMLTVDGVAELLACSPRTVYRLIDQGRIPQPARIGGMIRWPRQSFQQWVTDGCPAPADGRIRPRKAAKNL